MQLRVIWDPVLQPDPEGPTLISHAAWCSRATPEVVPSHLRGAQSPAWRDDAETPPLSASKAIKLANEMKDRLVKDSDDHKWIFQDASLHPESDGRWYWLVYYEFRIQQKPNGPL